MEIGGDNLSTVFITGTYEVDYPSLRANNIEFIHDLNFNIRLDYKHSFRVLLINHNEMNPDPLTYLGKLRNIWFLNITAEYIFISQNISLDLIEATEFFGLKHVIFLQPYSELISRLNEKQNLEIIGNFTDNLQTLNTSNYLIEYTYSSYWKNSNITICYRLNCENCLDGPEYKLFEIIFSFLNIKRKYSLLTQQNSTLCDVIYGRVISANYQNYHQYTVPYLDDHTWWFVPLTDPKNNGWFFFKIFSVMLWTLVLLSTAAISLLWLVIHISTSRKCGFTNVFQKTINIFSLAIEQSINLNTAKTSETILSTLVIFLTFMMNTVYKIKLLQVLIGKEYDYSINSLYDMIDRGMILGYPSSDFSPKAMQQMKTKTRACVNSFECLKRAALHHEFGVLVHGNDEKRYRRYLINENGKYLLRKLTPAFFNSKYVAMLYKGHPFYHVLNRYLTYLIEHGFVKHVNTDSDINYELELDNEVLNMDHFRILFALWLIMIILSTLVFIKEYLQVELSKKLKKF
ncbi:hypothetical protein WA026_005133 [Henosepilachna vigintioctopunctata]|uniref:Ionotropic receptor n=1 Tax=Henosepilachna vigintioctopunctata TaxID=420089 RepID=A0AAW1UUK9_9CUCU